MRPVLPRVAAVCCFLAALVLSPSCKEGSRPAKYYGREPTSEERQWFQDRLTGRWVVRFDSGAAEGDHELVLEGVRVVVDPFSAPYLQGATVDYLNGLQESGFKIDNPNAVSSCGCGHSFQVEEGEELPEGTQMGGCGSGCSH